MTDKQETETGCSQCTAAGSDEPHTCPFAEEINDDYDTLCTCCEDCVQECLWSI